MCGITGVAALNGSPHPTLEQLKTMCDSIFHRGPDQDGMHVQDGVALGMRRLSIIDLSGGRQPIFNQDRTILTVFNGEIYNFRELRSELEAKGYTFATKTDTEVIVYAYEEYGLEFPKYLNGMFAIALHDTVKKKLYLVRDHLGIKPLYYSFDQNYLVWGSEIKAILASGLVKKTLDLDALGEYLAWEYVPGKATLFKEIRQLEPGQMLEIDLENPQCQPQTYWDIPATGEIELSDQAWADKVESQLRKSVTMQLVSDVPLGAFLSGGVDSSLTVALMGKAQTYSIGFDDPSYNELKWSEKVASHLGVEHINEVIKPNVVELFEHLMYFLDDPIGDFSIFPTFLVSQLARKYVTVSLSGDGGDELFGGYETYLANDKAEQYYKIPAIFRKNLVEPLINSLRPRPEKKGLVNKAKRFIEGLENPVDLSHARWRIFAGDTVRSQLFTPEANQELVTSSASHIIDLFNKAGDRQPQNRSMYVDVKSYLSDDILVKVDRMSMAVSLESRVPYLDPDLVELAFQIPDRLKLANGETKVLLKSIAARHVPPECVYRPKEGFSIPIKNWLCNEFRPLMEELLSDQAIKDQGIFQVNTIKRLKEEHLAGTANHSHILWSLIVFQSWYKRWFKGE
ncbi:MAG: asparagine synthase (glutamine-hydrolyzing) [Oscillatoriales cyanobacterium CG2_30_40_61]|nr:MAG: asparagine synthase (glutamine-hydrolyzing) [Oscillatoriales cyanobacterium CG2_30_40_61]